MSKQVLTENDVVEAVVAHLTHGAWSILKTCSTKQRGVNILAERFGKQLAIEEKGGTSADLSARRHGRGFNTGQKGTHVAMALLAAARVVSEGKSAAGIAFPNDDRHQVIIRRILPALQTLQIQVFLVGEDMAVCDFPA